MKVLVLTYDEVRALLPMSACIEVMADALSALARGQVYQPLRTIVRPEGARGLMAMMPAYAPVPEPAFGLKLIGVFPGNVALGLDAHQGAVLLIDGETGALKALVNASAVTEVRTAAVSGVATRALARPEAGDLAMVGAGVQARSHLEAMACVRAIRRVRVAGRAPERIHAFVEEMAPRFAFPIEAVAGVEAAVRGAHIVVTATSSHEPVLRREWIAPGAHLNVVGASLAAYRETDSATMAAARLFVDRRQSTENEAGDYLIPLREGAIGPGHIQAEIGEVLTGMKAGRSSPEEITLFKSLGLAVEDLASAAYAYARARETGAGAWVEF